MRTDDISTPIRSYWRWYLIILKDIYIFYFYRSKGDQWNYNRSEVWVFYMAWCLWSFVYYFKFIQKKDKHIRKYLYSDIKFYKFGNFSLL